MPLRSGKEYLKLLFPQENQPFKLILLPEKKFNFDHASTEWRKNKVYHGYGQFTYK